MDRLLAELDQYAFLLEVDLIEPQDHDPCGRLAVEQQQASAEPGWQFERVVVKQVPGLSEACAVVDRRGAGAWCRAHDHDARGEAGSMQPIDEPAGRHYAAGYAGEPRVNVALTQLPERESLLVQPRGQVDSDAELAVKVPMAAGARQAAADPAGEVGLQLPTRVGGEMRVVGMLADLLKRRLRPALESRHALLAGLKDAVGDQPRAQVGGCRSEVVLVERFVRDGDFAAEHLEERRGGGASLQPCERASRFAVLLEPAKERLELCDRVRIPVLAELLDGVVQRAWVAALASEVVAFRAAVLAVPDRAGAVAGGAHRRAVDPRRRPLLDDCRREVEASAGPAPTREGPARDQLGLAQWRLYAALEESLRMHADAHAAVQVRCYVVVPMLPRQNAARAALAWAKRAKLPTAPLERPVEAHRRAVREHLAHVDSLRGELESEGMPTELLDGEQVTRLLWERFNPSKADGGRRPSASTVEVLGELEASSDRDRARELALRLKEGIAQSSLDFRASHQHVTIDRDVEQTIVVANTAGRTHMGWLHGAMLTRQPYTLSVYVHALERRRERNKLKLAYRRLFTINRGAEQRGRIPDFDRYVQEREYEGLLNEMATGDLANLFRVSIYQTIRARGPAPNLTTLAEAVDYCAENIESSGDCKVGRGEFRQAELWPTSLPLGRDVYRRARRKYPTANAGDMPPLVGTSCGSPTGIPFAFAEPGRTVENLNPTTRSTPTTRC